MSLPKDIPFDRRAKRDVEDGDEAKRHGYRRRDDALMIRAQKRKRWSRALGVLAAIVISAAIAVNIIIGTSGANHADFLSAKETQKRVDNVSALCNGINANNTYINTVVKLFEGKVSLPTPPAKLNCPHLLNNTLAESK